jgi:hypothetical protein
LKKEGGLISFTEKILPANQLLTETKLPDHPCPDDQVTLVRNNKNIAILTE